MASSFSRSHATAVLLDDDHDIHHDRVGRRSPEGSHQAALVGYLPTERLGGRP